MSELLFQISTAIYFVFPLTDWQLSCPELRETGSEVRKVMQK